MPVFWTKKPTSTLEIGLWNIDETIDELLENVGFNESELTEYHKVTSNSRKLEVLARRFLLTHLVGPEATLTYNENGKPFLEGTDPHISISHTKSWVAIALEQEYPTGIDVQVVNPKIERIASKFLNDTEAHMNTDRDALHVIWSCKEAMFKKYSEYHLPFASHIKVMGAESPVSGLVAAAYIKNCWIEHEIGYEKLENAHLAYIK